LGGGYPELHARELSANIALMSEIRRAGESGMPILAECGGFIYLCSSLKGMVQGGGPGTLSAMVGLFPFKAEMTERRTALGYREVTTTEDFPFLPAGETVRGHEYHYSRIRGSAKGAKRAFLRESMSKAGHSGSNRNDRFDGYLYSNCVASYTHLHFASNPALAPGFVAACSRFAEPSPK
jgi:cobyrinic acid a,c-diamide synthase